MDGPRFDRLTRMFTSGSSRRGLLLGISGATLGLTATRLPGVVAAKKKRKKKATKKLIRNSFGCVDVGKSCRGNSGNCCSGICQGQKPKKGKKDTSVCVAHDTGICQVGQDTCLGTSGPDPCGEMDESCFRTTGNATFCGKGGACFACKKDADCQTIFGPGAACAICFSGCSDTITACILPAA